MLVLMHLLQAETMTSEKRWNPTAGGCSAPVTPLLSFAEVQTITATQPQKGMLRPLSISRSREFGSEKLVMHLSRSSDNPMLPLSVSHSEEERRCQERRHPVPGP